MEDFSIARVNWTEFIAASASSSAAAPFSRPFPFAYLSGRANTNDCLPALSLNLTLELCEYHQNWISKVVVVLWVKFIEA